MRMMTIEKEKTAGQRWCEQRTNESKLASQHRGGEVLQEYVGSLSWLLRIVALVPRRSPLHTTSARKQRPHACLSGITSRSQAAIKVYVLLPHQCELSG